MKPERLKLDDRDIKILGILQKEGRIPKATLAERVNLSPTPCWERLKRLEKAGIIEGYGARISLKAFGRFTTLFILVEIESHRAEDFRTFEKAVAAIPEITECWAIGGGFDYLCKLITSDLDAFQQRMDEILESKIGVKRYYTYAVTKPVKEGPLPAAMLANREG